jgi:molybdenum cofactor cytidylyltransferase
MIPAIIPAAGESQRMGEPKLLMKWMDGTVLGHVVSVFARAGVEDILVITGSNREKIEQLVEDLANRYPVRCVYNSSYNSGEMLSSVQRGLEDLVEKNIGAAMIGLGDQPQVEGGSVKVILDEYRRTHYSLIVPSYQMRRGHPWLVGRIHWDEILLLKAPQTLRDFLSRHAETIHYVKTENASVLADLDTPADYSKSHPS